MREKRISKLAYLRVYLVLPTGLYFALFFGLLIMMYQYNSKLGFILRLDGYGFIHDIWNIMLSVLEVFINLLWVAGFVGIVCIVTKVIDIAREKSGVFNEETYMNGEMEETDI